MNDDEQGRTALYLQIQNTVANAVNLSEVAVLRQLVIELLKDNQRLSGRATDLKIDQQIYEKVNQQFADIADHDPKMATVFAEVLSQWKSSHGID